MSFYFLNESIREHSTSTVPDMSFPVKIRKSTWDLLENPIRFSKIFSFESMQQQMYFVTEIMNVSEFKSHEIKMIIEGRDVTVETYTHDLQDVTEIDLQIARACDQIFNDSKFVSEEI